MGEVADLRQIDRDIANEHMPQAVVGLLELPAMEGELPARPVEYDASRPLTRIFDPGIRKKLAELSLERALLEPEFHHAAPLRAGRPCQRAHTLAVSRDAARRLRRVVEQLEVGHESQLEETGAHSLRVSVVQLRAQQEAHNGQRVCEGPGLLALESTQSLGNRPAAARWQLSE